MPEMGKDKVNWNKQRASVGRNLAASILGKPGIPVYMIRNGSCTVLETGCDNLNEKNGKFLNT